LSDLIEYLKSHEGVWIATGSEIANWWLDNGFSAEAAAQVSKVA
jgi:hypothetical protein